MSGNNGHGMGAPDGMEPGKCNARKRDGGRCKQPAGHGTGQPFGPCKKHGGCLPGPKKAAAKAMLLDTANEMGLSIEIEPHDLMLATVYSAAGSLAVAQGQVAKLSPDKAQGSYWMEVLGQAQDRAGRVSKAAMDAGIAERRVRLAERTGALIAAAIEDAMGEMPEHFSPEVRSEFARRVQGRLAVLERTDGDEGG